MWNKDITVTDLLHVSIYEGRKRFSSTSYHRSTQLLSLLNDSVYAMKSSQEFYKNRHGATTCGINTPLVTFSIKSWSLPSLIDELLCPST